MEPVLTKNLVGRVVGGMARTIAVAGVAALVACSSSGDGEVSASDDTQASQLLPTGTGSVFEGAGIFVWHADAITTDTKGATLKTNGFSWVAVMVNDGASPGPNE